MEAAVQLTWTGYNNIGIAGFSILATLAVSGPLSVTKSLLIMPFAMHSQTVSHLANQNVSPRGIAALTSKMPELFINFNRRFEASLPVSINAIQLLLEIHWIELHRSQLVLVREFNSIDGGGERAKKILKAASNLSALLECTEAELYLNLRIEL